MEVPWHVIVNSPRFCSMVEGSSSMQLIKLQLQRPLLARLKCCIIFLKSILKNCTRFSKTQNCLDSALGECFLLLFSFLSPDLYVFFSVPCLVLNMKSQMSSFNKCPQGKSQVQCSDYLCQSLTFTYFWASMYFFSCPLIDAFKNIFKNIFSSTHLFQIDDYSDYLN